MTHPVEFIHPRNLKYLSEYLQSLIKGKLWLKIIIGLILGVALGIILGPSTGIITEKSAKVLGEWLALPGYFFLAMIQMIVVPLVFASIIRGLAAGENIEQLKKTGSGLLIYFLLTIIAAILIGVTIGFIIEPGAYIDPGILGGKVNKVELSNLEVETESISLEELPSELINILPQNPLGAMLDNQMLQVVIFSFIIGMGLVSLNAKQSRPLLELMGSVQSVCMAIVEWLMKLAPLAVFGLMAQVTLKTGIDILLGMGVYVLTVLFGMVVLMLFYMLIVIFISKRNPLTFLGHVREAQLLAFSTDSSAVVMPLSIKTAEEKLKVKPSISQFVIPIGATVNMGGSALYQGLATIFMAQVYGIDLGLGALLALIVTVVGASIGTPATPGVGIVILSTVLTSAGIPLEGIPLILGVDRVLEMVRTTLNVTGDLVACTVMDRFVKTEHTYEEELTIEQKHEEKRQEIGVDVITNHSGK